MDDVGRESGRLTCDHDFHCHRNLQSHTLPGSPPSAFLVQPFLLSEKVVDSPQFL